MSECMNIELMLRKCDTMLYQMLGRHDLVKTWWDSPNANWALRTPGQVWSEDAGGPDTVYRYLADHMNPPYS